MPATWRRTLCINVKLYLAANPDPSPDPTRPLFNPNGHRSMMKLSCAHTFAIDSVGLQLIHSVW